MSAQDHFRAALEAGDVAQLRRAWRELFPGLPQPKTDAQAAIVMHHARTGAQTVSLDRRAWSHRWLTERGLPSALPDQLKPRAERLYPRVVEGVGIFVGFRSPILKPATPLIRRAIGDAVEDVYADSASPDPAKVRSRMAEARAGELKRLFGSVAALRS